MAFWGIEVKAGKPYTHFYDNSRGRLRISQAALGSGKSTNKSSLQINVRNKSPVILCNLIPNVLETCHLELEFDEAEEVIFSVLGQRSVHLSGYYIGSSMRKLDGDETDSYGEDIAHTDTSASSKRSDEEDEYESDFIDDDVIEMSPPVRCKSGDEKPSNGNAKRRRLKKKHQSVSDGSVDRSQGKPVVQHDNSAVVESEDEDCFPISFSLRRKNKISDSEDDKVIYEDRKKKIDAISEDIKSPSFPCKETCHLCDTSLPSDIGQENNAKSKKEKDEKPLDVISRVPAEERENVEPDKDQDGKEVGIHKENGFGEENGKSKRSVVDGTETEEKEGKEKKKKKMKKGKISETAIEVRNEADNNDKMDRDDKEGGIHMENGVQFGEANDASRSAGVDETETDGKEEKKKKMKKGKISETDTEVRNEPGNNDKMDQDDKEGGIHMENGVQFGEANDESRSAGVEETETDGKEKKKKKKMKKGRISETAIEGINEADDNDKMDLDDKEGGTHKENGVQFGEANDESRSAGVDETETDGKEKKKKKKMKKGRISETAIEGINEADDNDKMDLDDKEGGTHKENGVQFEEGNDHSKRAGVDGTETDEKEKQKKKKMKGNISEAAIEGANEADNNDKMDRDSSPVSNEMEKLPHHSEGTIPSILSAAAQDTIGKLKKKSKKRTKDDRGCEASGVVADVIETGTRKKKEKNKHDKDLLVNQKLIEQGKLDETKAGLKSLGSPIEEGLAMGSLTAK